MKVFTIIQGIRIRRLLALILRRGITPAPLYLLRCMFLILGALPSSLLSRIEDLKYAKQLRNTRLVHPPLFIVGHWRTGSTFLHQLLHLHPSLTAPTLVQTSIPDHFLFSTPYYVPLLKKALPAHRPMDQVALGPFEPQEEEFALLRLGVHSPFEKLLFPSKKQGYFLKDCSYLPEGKALETWKLHLDAFYRKITLETGKQILSKNPWHSLRMPLLAGMYPGAKFIHITRDPQVVVPSTIRMWNMVARDHALRRGWLSPSLEEVAGELKRITTGVQDAGSRLATGHYVEVAFENLEQDPRGELKKLCALLNLEYGVEFRRKVDQFLEVHADYQKNHYSLDSRDRDTIRRMVDGESR